MSSDEFTPNPYVVPALENEGLVPGRIRHE